MDSRLRGNDEVGAGMTRWVRECELRRQSDGNAELRGSTARSKAAEAHPGSGSGTCFHSNRSSRQGPAHQGMKMGLVGGRTRV